MKLAVYQGLSPQGDIESAFDKIENTLLSVSMAGGIMVVFPELFLPGYFQPKLHQCMAQPQGGPWEQKLSQLTKKHKCGITIGWAENENDHIFNSTSCFDCDGKKIAHYRKLQLFGSVEKATFEVGSSYTTFALNGYKAAVLICYDVEFAHHVSALKKLGVELLLVPTANPASYPNVSDILVPARAAENQMTIAYANYCGEEADLVYGGRSVIVGPDSQPLVKAGLGEALMIADLEIVSKIDQSLLSTQKADLRHI